MAAFEAAEAGLIEVCCLFIRPRLSSLPHAIYILMMLKIGKRKKKRNLPLLKPVHAFFTRLRSCGVKAAFPRTREHVSVYIRTDLEKLRFGGQKDGSSSCTTLTKCDDYVVVVRLTKQAHRESETTQPKPPTQPAKPQI